MKAFPIDAQLKNSRLQAMKQILEKSKGQDNDTTNEKIVRNEFSRKIESTKTK